MLSSCVWARCQIRTIILRIFSLVTLASVEKSLRLFANVSISPRRSSRASAEACPASSVALTESANVLCSCTTVSSVRSCCRISLASWLPRSALAFRVLMQVMWRLVDEFNTEPRRSMAARWACAVGTQSTSLPTWLMLQSHAISKASTAKKSPSSDPDGMESLSSSIS